MKLKIFAALDLVVVFPLVGSAIAAGVEEPVQDGEEDGPLDGELEAATLQQLLDHMLAAGQEPVQDGEEDGPLDGELEAATLQQLLDHMLAAGQLPEPLKDQGRADVPDRDGRELALGILGEHEDRASQAGSGDEQGVELAALLELIESTQSGDDPLPGSSAFPAVLDDLEVGTRSRGLRTKEHGALQCGTP